MSNSLYMKMASFRKLYLFFLSFFAGLCSNRTSTTYVLFILSMLVVEGTDSIRSVFSHYFRKISLKSLNSLYYALSYAKFDSGLLCGRIAGKALSIIPKDLDLLPVFLCVDDTMVEKHGKKFEHVQKLFDHACHNGNKYMNGHCFVSVMLAIPVWHGRKYKYVGIPLGYKMWIKDGNSKLQIAADMIDQVMPVLSGKRNVIILCDSWYAKTTIFSLTKKYHNLDLICNAPVNTALYDIPPVLVGKKKRGAPRKHGAQITLDNFELSSETIDGYHVGVKTVMVNMLKWDAVYAFVTSPEKECGEKKKRLFISTIAPAKIQIFCAWYEKAPINQTGSSRMQYLPYMLYSNRWNIEVSYYEQKTFWSLSDYMVRSRHGIETLLNLINLAYAGLTILPYTEIEFEKYKDKSTQETRFFIEQEIQEEVFIANLLVLPQINNNSEVLKAWLESKGRLDHAA